jgi:hypothetical protein
LISNLEELKVDFNFVEIFRGITRNYDVKHVIEAKHIFGTKIGCQEMAGKDKAKTPKICIKFD